MAWRSFTFVATATTVLSAGAAQPPIFDALPFSAIGSSANAEEHRGAAGGPEVQPGERRGAASMAEVPTVAGDALPVSGLLGQPVYAANAAEEEQVGWVNDLLVDRGGTIPAVIVDIGRFLGISEHEVVIPFEVFEFRPDPENPARIRLYTTASRAELEAAPVFGLPPETAARPPASANGDGGSVRTSRTFLGPHEFPPEEFAAYGIVAFPALATPSTRQRHLAVCNAYVATLPTPSQLFVPESEQMVTVWPVDDSALAAELVERRDPELCETAVDRYDLPTALSALRHARIAGDDPLEGRGPFLLAWSPSSDKGSPDALVLVADLSTGVTSAHFEDYLRQWREDIELSPELWENGWSVSLVRTRIRDWADRWGPAILNLSGG